MMPVCMKKADMPEKTHPQILRIAKAFMGIKCKGDLRVIFLNQIQNHTTASKSVLSPMTILCTPVVFFLLKLNDIM